MTKAHCLPLILTSVYARWCVWMVGKNLSILSTISRSTSRWWIRPDRAMSLKMRGIPLLLNSQRLYRTIDTLSWIQMCVVLISSVVITWTDFPYTGFNNPSILHARIRFWKMSNYILPHTRPTTFPFEDSSTSKYHRHLPPHQPNFPNFHHRRRSSHIRNDDLR